MKNTKYKFLRGVKGWTEKRKSEEDKEGQKEENKGK